MWADGDRWSESEGDGGVGEGEIVVAFPVTRKGRTKKVEQEIGQRKENVG